MTVLPPMHDPDKVDLLVSAHLQKTLDSQRGRAVAAFRQHVKQETSSPDQETLSFEAARRRSVRMLRVWAGAASMLAASLALVVTLQFVHTDDAASPVARHPAAIPITPASVPVMDQVELSRDIDGGTQVVDNQPVQVVRQQQLKQMQWFDPNEKATYSVTEPLEKVGYVRLQPN